MVLSRLSTLKPGPGFAGALAGEEVCAKAQSLHRTRIRIAFSKRIDGLTEWNGKRSNPVRRISAKNVSPKPFSGQMAGQIIRDKRRIITIQIPKHSLDGGVHEHDQRQERQWCQRQGSQRSSGAGPAAASGMAGAAQGREYRRKFLTDALCATRRTYAGDDLHRP